MIKTISTLLLILMMFMVNAQPVKENGQLKVDGTQLVNQKGEPVVLRGVSFGWHNWWPRFYNEGTVKWLAEDWNCNIVRAAIGVEPDSGYINQPDFAIEKLTAVVDAAIEADIYVIIDWHAHHINLEPAKEFFEQMAKKYNKYPNVIYEVFNEPVKDSWEDVKAYSEEVIKVIRKYDADNIILVGSPHWDQDLHLVAKDPIKGQKNIMYTLHYYAATHDDFLKERGDVALKAGCPVFISESAGMKANGDGALDYEAWQSWIDWAEERKVSWITWSVADKNESCSMLLPEAASDGNWLEKHLKESGKKTREYLRKYNAR